MPFPKREENGMEQAESKVETTPFERVVSRFNIAAGKLGLDDALYQVSLTPDREVGLAIPVQMDIWKAQGISSLPCPAQSGARAVPRRHPLHTRRDSCMNPDIW
jgi:hypothetical protein